MGGLPPGSEMGRESVKVECQAIAGKDGQTIGGQTLGDVMDQLMSEGLRPRTEGVGTGIPLGSQPFLAVARAFALGIGDYGFRAGR